MAVSSSALIPRVRTYLDERPYVAVGTATNASTTTVSVTDGTDWAEGSIVEFQDNGEQCLVRSISSNDLTVIRGWNGTTAQTHTSITVFRDPQWTYQNIEQAIASAVRRLWPYAWKITTQNVTPDTTSTWFPITSSLCLGLSYAHQLYGTSDTKLGYFSSNSTDKPIVFRMDVASSLSSTTGRAVAFPEGFYHSSNSVVLGTVRAITGTSDIEDSGDLNVTDAVIYGTLARLITAKEAERVGIGEDLEQSRSIRVGGRLSAGAYYERMFRKELEALRDIHRRTIPIMPFKRFK